jgi:plastocyanin
MRRILAGALALSLAAVLGGASPVSAARTRVKIVDFAFRPKRVEIPQGTAVKWTNRGNQTHTVTSKQVTSGGRLFDSGELSPGESFRFRFTSTGVFRYRCKIHPEMKGRVLSGDV